VSVSGSLEALGGSVATTVLLAAVAGFLGLLGGLPLFLGPAVAVAGVVGSAVLRRRRRRYGGAVILLPAVVAVAVLVTTAPPDPGSELFAGLTSLALLLWLADDPSRAAGGGRRAVPTLAPAALAVGLAWAITLGLAGTSEDVGLAGSLLATGLVLLAFLFANLGRPAGRAAVTP
jgi:hypothetical protein